MIELFLPQTTPKPWGDEILVAQASGYTGKVLKRYAREPFHRAGLQYHTDKDETFYVYSGEAWVYFLNQHRLLCKARIGPGMSVHVPHGTVHSVQTITDTVMFEAAESAPFSQTVNVEDAYDIAQAVEVVL